MQTEIILFKNITSNFRNSIALKIIMASDGDHQAAIFVEAINHLTRESIFTFVVYVKQSRED